MPTWTTDSKHSYDPQNKSFDRLDFFSCLLGLHWLPSISMNSPETTKKELEETYKALLKMLEKISSKKYLDAIDKLATICSKQNPQLN